MRTPDPVITKVEIQPDAIQADIDNGEATIDIHIDVFGDSDPTGWFVWAWKRNSVGARNPLRNAGMTGEGGNWPHIAFQGHHRILKCDPAAISDRVSEDDIVEVQVRACSFLSVGRLVGDPFSVGSSDTGSPADYDEHVDRDYFPRITQMIPITYRLGEVVNRGA